MNTDSLRNFLRAVFKLTAQTAHQEVALDPRYPKVLPPFGGELGHEVRSFLGRVEPWLRSGWKILAKRPELYPAGTAFYDATYFEQESALLQKYRSVRLGFSYHFPQASYEHLQAHTAQVTIALSSSNPLKLSIQELRDIILEAKFERELRSLFAPFLLNPDRPLTSWDTTLLSVTNFLSYAHLADFVDVVVPSYLPTDFRQPAFTYEPHVGVQLRSRSEWSPDRNSDPQRVLALAQQTADFLQLPILIYGHPNGSLLPQGYIHTAASGSDGLLKRELGYLTQCQIMFAPDSGWADLMAWLRVPTLIEKEVVSYAFSWLQPFHPRLDVIQPDVEITRQVERVRSQIESLPKPKPSGVKVATPDTLTEYKKKFIRF